MKLMLLLMYLSIEYWLLNVVSIYLYISICVNNSENQQSNHVLIIIIIFTNRELCTILGALIIFFAILSKLLETRINT